MVNVENTDRFMEVSWDTGEQSTYQAEIQIIGLDKSGLLSNITQKLTDSKLSLVALNARTNKEKIATINISLEIKDIKQLRELMQKIRNIDDVIDVYRVTS